MISTQLTDQLLSDLRTENDEAPSAALLEEAWIRAGGSKCDLWLEGDEKNFQIMGKDRNRIAKWIAPSIEPRGYRFNGRHGFDKTKEL